MAQATVKQWMAWAERRMASLCIQERLDVAMIGATQGPLTVTFTLRLLRPSRGELARLLSLGAAMGQALQTSGVRLSGTAKGILVEVPAPLVRTPGADWLARASRWMRPAVGASSLREPVLLDLERWPHLLAVGPTRRGKTQALRSLLFAMASRSSPGRLLYLILAKKGEDWRAFQPAAGCLGLLTRPEEQEQALSWLAGDLLQVRAEHGWKLPHLLLLVDDLANIAARASISSYLGEAASLGGAAGIHLLLSTQTTGKAGGLTQDIEQNLTARLIFGAADAAAGARYAGSGGLQVETVGTAPGDALLLLDGQPQRVATGLCHDTWIASLPQGDLPAPWLLPEPAEPAWTPSLLEAGQALQGREGWPEPAPEPGYLDSSRPPAPEERARLRELYQETGSKNQTAYRAYGHKNGKVYQWITEALEETDSMPAYQQDSIPA